MRSKNWIAGATRNKGALREYVQRTYGKAGFDSEGNIKSSILSSLSEKKGTVGQRARLAITLKKLH